MRFPTNDREWEEHLITALETDDQGRVCAIGHNDGLWLGYPKDHPIQPKVGDVARFYGRGFGSPVRGLFINGQQIHYLTDDGYREKLRREIEEHDRQKREHFEREGKASLDAQYNALPLVFQKRLDRFRRNNPDFRWDFEPYEMFCCTEAVKIANELETPEAVEAFKELPYEEQERRVPGLSDGHSGNTFGCACYLAYWYLKEPEVVIGEQGALTVLVGSEQYGDVKRQDSPIDPAARVSDADREGA